MNQYYGADILMEYVIKGNAAILKCSIPSFVADFVRVESWIDEEGTELKASDDYGSNILCSVRKSLSLPILFLYLIHTAVSCGNLSKSCTQNYS